MTATTLPKITIGMTCFNAEGTIAAAIQSAAAQDWADKEILIVDDCSTDNSVSVIKDAIKSIPYARLIQHDINTGVGGAHNTLIKEASGDFIAVFDDDDVSRPERLKLQYDRITKFEATSQTKMIVCHTARIQKFPDGSESYIAALGSVLGHEPSGEMMARRTLIGEITPGVLGVGANCSRMTRTSILRELGGYDPALRRSEDTDFNVRFALQNGHFIGIAEPLVIQTMTTGTDKHLDDEYQAQIRMYEKHRGYLQSIGWASFNDLWLEARFAHLRRNKPRLALLMMKAFLTSPIKCIKKILWSLPERRSRKTMQTWYKENFVRVT